MYTSQSQARIKQPRYFSASDRNSQYKQPVLSQDERPLEDIDEFLAFGKNSPSGSRANIRMFGPSPSPVKPNSPGSPRIQTPSSGDQTKTSSVYVFSTQKNLLQSKGRPRLQREAKNPPRQGLSSSRSTAQLGRTDLGSVVTSVKSPTARTEGRRSSELIYREHLFQTFQALKFVQTLPQIEARVLRQKRVNLTKRQGYESRKTIVFDLDETLVHCCENTTSANPDIVIPVTFPTGEVVNAGINIRPFAVQCLREANKYFEVIVFTASHKCYADAVLNHIDPSGQLIHHRLYRDNCIQVQGIFVKDLRILAGRRIEDIVIVDNAAYSFGYQLDNGIPIISWHDDRQDRELYNLMDYMKVLAFSEDVRLVNRQTFHLCTFYEDYIQEFMMSETERR